MLQACLNGGRTKQSHSAVPITPEEIANAAIEARDAGADELHIHVHRRDGSESLEPIDLDATLSAVRSAVPSMPIGISSGLWITNDHDLRLDAIRHWTTLPDYASVNVNEQGAQEVVAILIERGIGVEAGLWVEADAKLVYDWPELPSCLRLMLELMSEDPAEARQEALRILNALPTHSPKLPILLHGLDGSAWAMIEMASEHGFDSRVGFEDTLTLPDGSLAPNNGALVRAGRATLGQ